MNPELEAIEIGIACAKQAAPEAAAATESFLSEMWGKIFSSRKACNSVATSIAKTAEEVGAPKVRIPCIHPATDSPSRIFPDAFSTNSTEAKLYEKASGAVVKIDVSRLKGASELGDAAIGKYSGSGFLLKNNLIATNYHVVRDGLMVQPQIILKDGTKLSCKLIARDKVADLALLKITNKPESLILDTLDLAPQGKGSQGLPVFSIGHPNAVADATIGSGQVRYAARWDANEALSNGNEIFQKGYKEMKKTLDYASESWFDRNPQSIRNTTVSKLETTVPTLKGASGSPLLDSDGSVRGIVSHLGGTGAECTHVDHLHALLKAAGKREIEDGWLDVFTKFKSLGVDTGKIKVSVTSTREVPWSKAIGMFSEKVEHINKLLAL
jgi:S1-C subfamily serine protease